jgi:PadR family transcriptional regulator, regulatory protein PadR
MADILGAFEQAILLAVLHLGSDAYGRTILHRVQTSLDRKVYAGAVYTTLDRLEKRGLLSSRIAEGTSVRGGRPRRYYSVSTEGAGALNDAHQTLSKMWRSIQWPAKIG